MGDGKKADFFLATNAPAGERCKKISRACVNGELTGDSSYAFSKCDDSKLCMLDGAEVKDKEKIKAYLMNAVDIATKSNCSATTNVITRTCSNGKLSGDDRFAFSSCIEKKVSDCYYGYPQKRVYHGGSTSLYTARRVPFGSSCGSVSKIARCIDGQLSVDGGSAREFEDSCEVAQREIHCGFRTDPSFGDLIETFGIIEPEGVSQKQIHLRWRENSDPEQIEVDLSAQERDWVEIRHGESGKFFHRTISGMGPSYAQSCQEETRTCSYGKLSGTAHSTACQNVRSFGAGPNRGAPGEAFRGAEGAGSSGSLGATGNTGITDGQDGSGGASCYDPATHPNCCGNQNMALGQALENLRQRGVSYADCVEARKALAGAESDRCEVVVFDNIVTCIDNVLALPIKGIPEEAGLIMEHCTEIMGETVGWAEERVCGARATAEDCEQKYNMADKSELEAAREAFQSCMSRYR